MKMRASVAISAACLAMTLLAPARAQVVIRGGVVINGGNVVLSENAGVETAPALPDPAGPHALDFADGEQLHGTLEALDVPKGQLQWKRAGISGTLSLPLSQISRVTFDQTPPTKAARGATIKFVGGDWLIADVKSIKGDAIQLQLSDGARLTTDRAHVEWIYFSKTEAAECYDGPMSMAGWTSVGGWTYREGALRASGPPPVVRNFGTLPDRVEYRLTVDQGTAAHAFTLALHGPNLATPSRNRHVIQLMVRADTLQLWGTVDGSLTSVQSELKETLGASADYQKKPMQLRVLEDFPRGRLLFFINGRKAASWTIDEGEAGKNGGALQFQPTSWSGNEEQSLSHIQVLPWDGREPLEERNPEGDRVQLVSGEIKTGMIASLDAQTLKLGAARVARAEVTMLRFRRPAEPPDDAAPVARLLLRAGGEFDATTLGWRDGKILARTNFGGEVSLAPAAIGEINFARDETRPPKSSAVLVFENGDRLHGSLESTTDAGTLRWRTENSDTPLEIASDAVKSLQFPDRQPGAPAEMVARFRNGDWLGGTFLTLDREQLVLETKEAGQLSIPRAAVKALYFSADGAPPVSDGAADHEEWERGLALNTSPVAVRSKPAEISNPWKYAAGKFLLARSANANASFGRNTGNQLGRIFDHLGSQVEVNFTVSAERAPIFFTAQLFSDPHNPGYMMHLSTVGIAIYDMNPRARGLGISQQQFPFKKNVDPNALERDLRILADRTSGRLTILVDGVVTARIIPKTNAGPRDLGRGLNFSPQPTLRAFSHFWVGPWNGRLPEDGSEAETIALANGDEVEGTVDLATPSTMKVTSEVGPLDLPVERVTVVDFGGAPVGRGDGARLQFAGQGALTVSAWRIEKDTVNCRSEIVGELKIPLALVQEIVPAAP